MSEILTINNEKALNDYGLGCLKSQKHVGYKPKCDWLMKNFSNGMTIKLIHGEKKAINFIEYVPIENSWRGVNGKGFYFIHCMWVYPKTKNNKGNGSKLIQEVIREAKQKNQKGVCVITSSGTFMVDKSIFLKNGFKIIEENGKYSLLCYTFEDIEENELPHFTSFQKELRKYKDKGLIMFYSDQCPTYAKCVQDLSKAADENQIDMKIIELKTSGQARNSVSLYGTFAVIYKGKILADHYISKTRFLNILKNEKLIS